MTLIKKVKELIARGCCVVDTDLIDDPPRREQQAQPHQQQQIEEQHEQHIEHQTAEVNTQVRQPEIATEDNETPILTDDEEITEEEEIYQTEYTSMDPDQVSISFSRTYENYMDKVENRRQSLIFTDNAWEIDNTVLNAYEYINPVSGDIYQDTEQDTPDSGIYQSHYESMDPEEIEISYANLNDKYTAFLNTLSIPERSKDPWKSGMTLAHPYNYFMPAEINPYAVSHPCEPKVSLTIPKEEPTIVLKEDLLESDEELLVPEQEDIVYQKEYTIMDPDQVSLAFNETQAKFMDILDKRHTLIYNDDAWQTDGTILNAYEYINPATEDLYENQESDTEDSGIYQFKYDSINPETVDQLYGEWSNKFATLRNNMVSPEQSADPWKADMVLLRPFDYFMPAEINPYVIAHPCEKVDSVPSLTHEEDVSEEEEHLTPDEIYQTEYSAMDPDQISISFNKRYEKFKNFLEQDKENIIFKDDPWETDKMVLNAYEYINPASNDKYKDIESSLDDSEIYQVNYCNMPPKQVDQVYTDMYRKYYAFVHNMSSLEESKEDPWKSDIVFSHAFQYLPATEINPYVVAHPFEEDLGSSKQDRYDYIYQTEYSPMNPRDINYKFMEEYRTYQRLLEEQRMKARQTTTVAIDPWLR